MRLQRAIHLNAKACDAWKAQGFRKGVQAMQDAAAEAAKLKQNEPNMTVAAPPIET